MAAENNDGQAGGSAACLLRNGPLVPPVPYLNIALGVPTGLTPLEPHRFGSVVGAQDQPFSTAPALTCLSPVAITASGSSCPQWAFDNSRVTASWKAAKSDGVETKNRNAAPF